ncbi:MAG: peptidoglycan DD-metalloendopeptidase family protein [Gammaproteobacteria bacterium]|nr:peptidoglycan DD-metalloendopeptidase family protein [Gammaproteobacteria bacterium]
MSLIKIIAVALSLLLVGCELKPFLDDRFDPAVYVVERGDSVYSISWRNRLDFKKVIVWNALHAPYTIHPGQRLTLRRPVDFVLPAAKPISTPMAVIEVEPEPDVITSAIAIEEGSGFDSTPLKVDSVHVADVEHLMDKKPAVPVVPKLAAGLKDGVYWSWPTNGQVNKKFQPQNKLVSSVEIAGEKGQVIRSTAEGVVMVSNFVRGYGKMLLISHKSGYLSGYMRNDRLLVSEGDRVKRGEKIALMGHQAGKKQAILHFEIRKKGQPVDPELYLPRL